MPTRSRRMRDAAGRPATPVEIERRRQILDATVAVIARAGWAGCTLQSVADEIGVTKAAVIYHVGTKVELVRQAYAAVIEAFTAYVAQEVAAASDPLDAVLRFARAHVDYMSGHPDHARVIVEALDDMNATGIGDSPRSPERAAPLAALIDAARAHRSGTEHAGRHPVEATVLAVIIAGAVDAAVQAWQDDPVFDLDAANRAIEVLVRSGI